MVAEWVRHKRKKVRMKEKLTSRAPGIAFCAAAAVVATGLASLSVGGFKLELIGAPVIAIVAGMIIATAAPSFATHKRFVPGTTFTGKKILQYAVVVLGFTLNITTIASVGATTLPIIVVTIGSALITAFLMMRLLGLDSKLACLLGVGSCICGGSAIAATAPVIKASDKTVAQAVSVVFLFNVVAALTFPTLGQALGLGSGGFAVFAGTAVNDTSSVTATAATAESIYGVSGILSAAVTVKLTRTLAIVPITLILAIFVAHQEHAAESPGSKYSVRKTFPTFILFFIAAALITTLVGLLPVGPATMAYTDAFVPAVAWLAKFLIAMAMFAIGLKTNLRDLAKGGAKPILVGLACWAVIIAVSLGMQLATGTYFLEL